MSRNRFEKLITNIHFANNLEINQTDRAKKIWKIRPWLSTVRENFLPVSPEEYQSVDEIMVAFKGRSVLKQYMPAKPHEQGSKLWGRSVKVQVDLSRPYIVKTYNKYMEGIAKLDMMCALYKPSLESRRWFIYLWLHSIMITVVNVRILYCRHQKALGIRRHYQAQIASSLAAAGKPRRERPSSEGPVPAKKRRESMGRPTKDIQKDHVDHMPS